MRRAPRPAIPRHRLGRRRRRDQGGFGRAAMVGRRPGGGDTALHRRAGPGVPERRHAGGAPARLGIRDEFRWPRALRRRQSQPAPPQAGAPLLGGGGVQHAVRGHGVPDAGGGAGRSAQAGRHRPGMGSHRWPGQLRGTARAERRRHRDRRGELRGEAEVPCRARLRRGHQSRASLGSTSTAGPAAVLPSRRGAGWAERSDDRLARTRTSSSSTSGATPSPPPSMSHGVVGWS